MSIKDKLDKVDTSFTVNMYDNGFMVETCGRDEEDEYATSRLNCSTVEELLELIKEVTEMDRID